VGIGQSGNFNFSGGGEVCGTLDADNTAQVNISGGGTTITCGIVRMSMSSIQNAALAASNAAASLTPTQTFNSITSSQTIVGNGGQNVILVTQLIHLSGGNLIISGGSSDTFIFNVTQGLQLDGGANIVLQGVPATNVLFNFPGSGDQIQTSGNAQTAGILPGPESRYPDQRRRSQQRVHLRTVAFIPIEPGCNSAVSESSAVFFLPVRRC
jgi:hypothetical protein